MATAAGKPFKVKKPFKKGSDMQLAYLMAAVKSLVKRGLKNAAKPKKRKCCFDLSSSDSNSK